MKPIANNARPKALAFTLVEMLVVIAIAGVLMSIALPGIKKLRRQDPLSLGAQQMLDDLEWARIHAMARGADVYMVFFPLWSQTAVIPVQTNLAATTLAQNSHFQSSSVANSLLGGQCASYAIFAEGSAGEQPGQPIVEQTFLTKWRRLPPGVVIPASAFNTATLFPAACRANLPRLANDDLAPADFGLLNLPAIRFHAHGELSPQVAGSLVLPLRYYGTNLVNPAVSTPTDMWIARDARDPARRYFRQTQVEISSLSGRPRLLAAFTWGAPPNIEVWSSSNSRWLPVGSVLPPPPNTVSELRETYSIQP